LDAPDAEPAVPETVLLAPKPAASTPVTTDLVAEGELAYALARVRLPPAQE
jgi:hypothetical protein